MSALIVILNRVFIKQFYRQNTAFSLMVFFLGFGIQQPPSLLVSPAFLTGAVASPLFVGVILVLFTLYYCKCFNFISKTIALPENEYLYVAGLFPPKTLRFAFALVHLLLFLPALAYTMLMGYYSFSLGLTTVPICLLAYNLTLLSITVYYYSQYLHKTIPAAAAPNFFSHTERKILAHPIWWPLRYLLRQEKVMLVLTKIISLGILYAFMALYPYQNFGFRPTQVGFLMAVTAQAMLVRQIQTFQETGLTFLRQLPYRLSQRFGHQILLLAVLILPEILLVLGFTLNITTLGPILGLYGLGIGILALFVSLLYLFKLKSTPYVRGVFFIFISLLLLILSFPAWYLLIGLTLLLAYLLFYKYYYRFELPEN